MEGEKFERELRLEKHDAADFLREIADTVEDDKEIRLEGEDWKLYQPYEDTIPFRLTQDSDGLEIDLKMLDPDR